MMRKQERASLWLLIWWSVRLAWAKRKPRRRQYRQRVWLHLERRWRKLVPDSAPGMEVALVRAVWLGAALASRSIVRYPLLVRRPKGRLIVVSKMLGRTNGKAIIAAYLAWTWVGDMARTSVIPVEHLSDTSG